MSVLLNYFSAGGCPLAETLAHGGLNVLLVERGTANLPPSIANSKDFWDAVSYDIVHVICVCHLFIVRCRSQVWRCVK